MMTSDIASIRINTNIGYKTSTRVYNQTTKHQLGFIPRLVGQFIYKYILYTSSDFIFL